MSSLWLAWPADAGLCCAGVHQTCTLPVGSQRTCWSFSSIACCRARSLKHKELSEYDLRKLEAEGDKKDRDRKIQGRIEVRSSVPQESKAERLPEHQCRRPSTLACIPSGDL